MKKSALILISLLLFASCSKGEEKNEIQNDSTTASQVEQASPEEKEAEMHDATRANDVKEMGRALAVYFEDGEVDSFVLNLEETPTFMGTGAGEMDVCATLVPTYIASLPVDPGYERGVYESCEDYHLGYAVEYDSVENEVIFSAPFSEGDTDIEYSVKTEFSEQLALVSRGMPVAEEEEGEIEEPVVEEDDDGYFAGIFNSAERARDAQRVSAMNNLNLALATASFEGTPYPENGCVNAETWSDYLPSLGGSVAVAFKDQEIAYSIDSSQKTACKNGEFWFQKKPGSGQYSYGLYTYVAGAANANAACSNLSLDGTSIGGEVAEGDSCYVILGM